MGDSWGHGVTRVTGATNGVHTSNGTGVGRGGGSLPQVKSLAASIDEALGGGRGGPQGSAPPTAADSAATSASDVTLYLDEGLPGSPRSPDRPPQPRTPPGKRWTPTPPSPPTSASFPIQPR